MWRRIRLGVVLASTTLLLGGCFGFCNDKCVAPRAPVTKALGAPVSGHAKVEAAAMVDPTAGIIMAELKDMIGQLSTLAETVSGEVKAATQQVQASASQVLAEMDHTFARRQDALMSDMTEQERRLAEDARVLIALGKKASLEIQDAAFENARETLYESDIVAYNALRDIPCQDKAPRLVFAKPRQFRIWPAENLVADPTATAPDGGGSRSEAYVEVRGNYMAFAEPQVAVRVGSGEARPARVVGSNANGFTVVVAGESLDELQGIPRPTPLTVETVLQRCPHARDKQPVKTAASVTVLPPLTYEVAVTIAPRAELPAFGSSNHSFSEMGSNRCDDRKSVTQTFSVGPPAEVLDWNLTVRSLGGNSHIQRVDRAGPYSVKVDAILAGKGRDCFLGICNCKGRGWVDYNLKVSYQTFSAVELQTSTQTAAQQKPNHIFRYPVPLPAGRRSLTCKYFARVAVSEGEQKTDVELSDVTPGADTPAGRITSTVDPATCNVSVQLPPALVAKLQAEIRA